MLRCVYLFIAFCLLFAKPVALYSLPFRSIITAWILATIGATSVSITPTTNMTDTGTSVSESQKVYLNNGFIPCPENPFADLHPGYVKITNALLSDTLTKDLVNSPTEHNKKSTQDAMKKLGVVLTTTEVSSNLGTKQIKRKLKKLRNSSSEIGFILPVDKISDSKETKLEWMRSWVFGKTADMDEANIDDIESMPKCAIRSFLMEERTRKKLYLGNERFWNINQASGSCSTDNKEEDRQQSMNSHAIAIQNRNYQSFRVKQNPCQAMEYGNVGLLFQKGNLVNLVIIKDMVATKAGCLREVK